MSGAATIPLALGHRNSGEMYVTWTDNAGAAGTTANLLVVHDSSGLPVTAGLGADDVLGVALTTASSGEEVDVVFQGVVNCVAEDTITAGHLVSVGISTAGRVRDSGTAFASQIMVYQIIGYALSSATAGDPVTVYLTTPALRGTAVSADLLFLEDNATANTSTTKHGFAPKLSNDATTYLSGVGTYTVPGSLTVRLTGDVAMPSTSASYSDVTGLSFSAAANKDYFIEAYVIYTGDTASVGADFSVNGPASPTSITVNMWTFNTALAGNQSQIVAYDTNSNKSTATITGQNMWMEFKGIFRNGANAGTFIVRHRLETGTAAVNTVLTGSFIRYRLMN
jgi:hypothetical protein